MVALIQLGIEQTLSETPGILQLYTRFEKSKSAFPSTDLDIALRIF